MLIVIMLSVILLNVEAPVQRVELFDTLLMINGDSF
jgi:hypothetical protein